MRGLGDCLQQLRRLVEDHDRCEIGKHWHDELHKCLPIPDELAMQRRNAAKRSQQAHGQSHLMKRSLETWTDAGLHKTAHQAHKQQAHEHGKLARDLKKAGFGELAQHHERVAAKHSRKADAHEKLSKGCQ